MRGVWGRRRAEMGGGGAVGVERGRALCCPVRRSPRTRRRTLSCSYPPVLEDSPPRTRDGPHNPREERSPNAPPKPFARGPKPA